jgi:Flp pilus assembly protein TadD
MSGRPTRPYNLPAFENRVIAPGFVLRDRKSQLPDQWREASRPAPGGARRSPKRRGSVQSVGGVLVLASLLLVLAAPPARAQGLGQPGPRPISGSTLDLRLEKVWPVFGRVLDVSGEPVLGAKVRVDARVGLAGARLLETNARGEFRTDYTIESSRLSELSVDVVARKEGYAPARETLQMTGNEKSRELVLILRPENEPSDVLSLDGLIARLLPRLGSREALASVPGKASEAYRKGIEELARRKEAEESVDAFNKAARRSPQCIECRMSLALALADAGSLASADRELREAEKLAPAGKAVAGQAELAVILATFETWQGDLKEAVGYLHQALQVEPANPLVLQEMGRVLILQKDWENADRYLEKAIRAGATREARLLRARALLEENDPDSAEIEMKAYLGKSSPQDLPRQARMVYLQLKERLETQSYGRVTSVVTEPLKQLEKALPELRGLEPASNQEELPQVLDRVGKNVAAFFRDFPDTISEEDIVLESLRRNGKIRDSRVEKYDYLMLAHPEKWGLGLTEYRNPLPGTDAKPAALSGGSIRTAGFASMSLVFHPLYQSGSSFRLLGRETVEGQNTYVLAYAQQPGKSQMIGRFDVDGASAPLLTQGIAWLDPDNFQIIRMRSDLLKSLPHVRLVRETADVQYTPVSFKQVPAPLWLPKTVTVTVQWKGRVFRNSHSYSDYKLFDVKAHEKRKAAAATPAPQGP